MKKKLLVILLVMLFISCSNRGTLKEELKVLQSKSIIIPTDAKMTVFGRDSIIPSFMGSELKLIVYSDSIVCSPCAIEYMYLWEDFFEYAEGHNNRLKYYFIFTPKKNDDYSVRFALKKSKFYYPVILDSKGEFAKLNPHLPKNKVLHTFLLDKDNNVVLVGSPLNNPKIETLFKTTVDNLLSDKKGS